MTRVFILFLQFLIVQDSDHLSNWPAIRRGMSWLCSMRC